MITIEKRVAGRGVPQRNMADEGEIITAGDVNERFAAHFAHEQLRGLLRSLVSVGCLVKINIDSSRANDSIVAGEIICYLDQQRTLAHSMAEELKRRAAEMAAKGLQFNVRYEYH